MHSETDNLIRFARAYCAEKLPWFAPILFQCQIELTDQVPLAAIDQHLNIYFNPEAVGKIAAAGDRKSTLAQLGFVWIHEISHILREHGDRAKAVNASHAMWNIAADLEINDSDWEGLQAPEIFPLLFPKDYQLEEGQLTEYYYQKLQEQKEEKETQESEDSDDDSPNNPMEEEQDDTASDAPDSSQDSKDKNNQHPTPDEGSGVHGKSRPWELEKEAEEKEVRIETAKQHKDGLEVEMIRKSVAQAMSDHDAEGQIAGGWERWANAKLKPKVNWRRVLKHRMSIAINKGVGNRVDYTYSRPGRRQSIHRSILLPTLRGDMSARVACVVDTSGSIKDNELSQIVGEVLGILRSFNMPVTIIPCDAKAYTPIKVAVPSDAFKLQKLPGGGGTNMIVGIEAAMALKPRPDSILVLTDGFTPYPQKCYSIPVLFGILRIKGKVSRRPPNPPWRNDMVVEILL